MERLTGPKVVDLLWHLPSSLIDRRSRPKIAEARDGEIATLEVQIGLHVPPRTKRLPYRVHVSDETGEMQLVFFNARADYLDPRRRVERTHPEVAANLAEAMRSDELTLARRLLELTEQLFGDRPQYPGAAVDVVRQRHGWPVRAA